MLAYDFNMTVYKRFPLDQFSLLKYIEEVNFFYFCSAYHGFFTKSATKSDRRYANKWIENETFGWLSDPDILVKKMVLQQSGWESDFDLMDLEQFLRGVLRYFEATKEEDRSWHNSGENHINPVTDILRPCRYPYKYCKYMLLKRKWVQ